MILIKLRTKQQTFDTKKYVHLWSVAFTGELIEADRVLCELWVEGEEMSENLNLKIDHNRR
jgi:hypothetical protein